MHMVSADPNIKQPQYDNDAGDEPVSFDFED